MPKGFFQNPYETYDLLRTAGPVRRVSFVNWVDGWLVTRHADARRLLDDRRLLKNRAGVADLMPPHAAGAYASPLFDHMLNSDPPDHTRLRKLVTKAFTARAVARLRPRIEEIADALLDVVPAGETVDLLDGFAFPLPIIVICELLGVPAADRDQFRQWSRPLVAAASLAELAESTGGLSAYLRKLIAEKRAAPTQDVLSDLVHVSDDGDRLSPDELLNMAVLLLVAGFETTVNLIGNSVLALLRNPGQLKALRADPSLVPGAVEEFLRYEGPVHFATMRYTAEPVEAGGVEIPAGEFVLISLLAANRDPEKFPDPDRLDVTRPAAGHVAFGHGIHYCLGAPLARLEGAIALGRLLDRFGEIELAAEPADLRWRGSVLVHGLHRLPVRMS
ncbi:cytochrome P450 [Amycolatopsis acidiphila]|uniref:Cytochrome P450 n=1 Tax=Amycolatopsis acidiphila TaxID=715473 RepID=A0A558A6A1_9PSEU|nr:cytochrome P450 [Amycolatopsis acidiphila]TVT19790.1 cytochrome P450 [Amycolatopsis acidiphila]UIJ63808.1 cytochrome P450 [Amycolatopsis acidiphila]GHG57357.1 cytochrome P450 [Amycolatopsis acidiphila]